MSGEASKGEGSITEPSSEGGSTPVNRAGSGAGSAPAKADASAEIKVAVQKLVEHRKVISFSVLGKVIWALPVPIAVTLVAFLIGCGWVGYFIHPWIQDLVNPPKSRAMGDSQGEKPSPPTKLPFEFSYETEPPDPRVYTGWKQVLLQDLYTRKGRVVLCESTRVSRRCSTFPFFVKLEDFHLSGYAILSRRLDSKEWTLHLPIQFEPDAKRAKIAVPGCEVADSMVLFLVVSSQSTGRGIPTAEEVKKKIKVSLH